ncbi:hypothetical protein ABZ761_42770 [Kitasatospora sp. NPDC006786]|uniref:hypothetical protein n=1 Tax=Kitasatospora sp. NPDC006786 TaxID=3157187 RepID=UPI0033EB397E
MTNLLRFPGPVGPEPSVFAVERAAFAAQAQPDPGRRAEDERGEKEQRAELATAAGASRSRARAGCGPRVRAPRRSRDRGLRGPYGTPEVLLLSRPSGAWRGVVGVPGMGCPAR